jgi:hypothetical protein
MGRLTAIQSRLPHKHLRYFRSSSENGTIANMGTCLCHLNNRDVSVLERFQMGLAQFARVRARSGKRAQY